MLTLAMLLTASMFALQATTTVVLGHAERDLTGDSKPEILRVVGAGPSIDDLGVTFTIESAGKTIYRYDMERMTRTVGFDAGRHVMSEAHHRTRIKEYGQWFFGEEKFQRPEEFVEFLRTSGRSHRGNVGIAGSIRPHVRNVPLLTRGVGRQLQWHPIITASTRPASTCPIIQTP